MCCDDPPHKKNWRLYHLLDLIPPVSTKQIQWNFRKVTLRHHYYRSYLVLYNKSRKFLYDAAGEDAYGFIASGTWGPLVTLFGHTGSILVYCLFMMIEIALLLIFFALLGARVDGAIDMDWWNVIIPLMVLTCLMSAITFFALLVNWCSPRTRKESMASIDRISPLGNLCAAVCYTCIPFILGKVINDDPHAKVGKYLTYMVMPILGDIFYYLTSLIWRWPRRLRMQMQVENNSPSPIISWGIFFFGFVHMACGIAQWVLIGQKLDGDVTDSWYMVFIPFAVRAGARVFEAFLRSCMKRTIGVRSVIGVAFDTLGSFFHNGILIISLYFVAVHLERGSDEVRLPYALIPVYVTLGYIFLCLIITGFVLLIKTSSKASDENRINNTWQPPPPKEIATDDSQRSGTQTSSNAGPIPGEVRKDRNWDDFDEPTASNSSGAFPSALEEDVGVEADYDDFYSEDNNTPVNHSTRPERKEASSYHHPASAPAAAAQPRRDVDDETYDTPRRSAPQRDLHHDPYDPKTESAPVVLREVPVRSPTASATPTARSDDYTYETGSYTGSYEYTYTEQDDDRSADEAMSSSASSSAFSSYGSTPIARR